MEWRGVLFSLCFIVTLVESSGRSEAMWLVSLNGEQTILYSWTICSASIFVLVALVLSMYLVFEHLAAYNQPEVWSFILPFFLMLESSLILWISSFIVALVPFLSFLMFLSRATLFTCFLLSSGTESRKF